MKTAEEIRARMVELGVELLDKPEEYDNCEEALLWVEKQGRLDELEDMMNMTVTVCCECSQEIARDEEMMVCSRGRIEHLNECPLEVKQVEIGGVGSRGEG